MNGNGNSASSVLSAAPPLDAHPRDTALYIYCIGLDSGTGPLGAIGLNDRPVYPIAHRGLRVVVHDCPPEPYRSDQRAKVEDWVLAHQRVLQEAWDRMGTILPFSFDTIVQATANTSARDSLIGWLDENHTHFLDQLERLRDKAEYGVQVFWDAQTIAAEVLAQDVELQKLQRELEQLSPGLAYLRRQKLDGALKDRLENWAKRSFQEFHRRIDGRVHQVRVDRLKKGGGSSETPGRQMLMNLSCLAQKDDTAGLGDVLEEIGRTPGLSVRFTGPWPPFSFVSCGTQLGEGR